MQLEKLRLLAANFTGCPSASCHKVLEYREYLENSTKFCEDYYSSRRINGEANGAIVNHEMSEYILALHRDYEKMFAMSV